MLLHVTNNYPPLKFVNDPSTTARGWYTHGDDKIHITQLCHGAAIKTSFEKRPDPNLEEERLQWVGMEKAYGIDGFKRTLIHESTHKRLWEHWNSQILTNPSPQFATDRADSDGDKLSDSFEITWGLDPLTLDTTEWNGITKSLTINGMSYTYTGYGGDFEVAARLVERDDPQGARSSDWADDGLNYGTGVPCDADRAKVYYFSEFQP